MIDRGMMVLHRRALASFLLLWGVTASALAQPIQQSNNGATALAVTPQAAAEPGRTAPGQPVEQLRPPIGSEQAVYLVRSTLLTLNDANRSGNYTVLRDLAAPDFQAKNTAADLAQSFAELRRRKFDLFAAALLPPQFAGALALDASGRLRLTGFFPTRPLEISFELTFQSVNGEWRLLAVSVATPAASAREISRQDPPHSHGLFYGFRILSGTAGWRW